MQARSLILLAVATVILVAIAIVVLASGDRGVSRAAPGQLAFPALAAKLGDVASVTVSRDGNTMTFIRDGDSWLVAEKGNYPANAAKVSQIVRAMADLTLVEPKTQNPDLYPRLELEDPGKGKSALVAVKDKSGGDLAQAIVGKRRYDRLGAGNDGVYLRKPGEAQTWLARGALDPSGDPASWLDRQIIDISEKKIAKVTLTQADGTKLVISRSAPDASFAVEDAPADTKFKNESTIGGPAAALETLDLDDVKPVAELPVPDKDVVTASFTTFDGLTVDLRLMDRDKSNWIAISATGSGPAAGEAKKIDDKVSHWTYAIPVYKANLLKTKLADLVEPAKGS
ncbi:MAG: DUF4340 domain-containing protein [Alphaproteobacteria bacterium]|nr:DUF4340 domain-containing protein [Alphaproteobacteria bacterium]